METQGDIDVQSRKPMCPKACAHCHQIASPLFSDHKSEQLYCGRCLEIVGLLVPTACANLEKSSPFEFGEWDVPSNPKRRNLWALWLSGSQAVIWQGHAEGSLPSMPELSGRAESRALGP